MKIDRTINEEVLEEMNAETGHHFFAIEPGLKCSRCGAYIQNAFAWMKGNTSQLLLIYRNGIEIVDVSKADIPACEKKPA